MKKNNVHLSFRVFIKYYLKWVIVGLLLVAAFVYVLWTTVYHYQKPALSIAVIESGEIDTAELEEDLYRLLDLEGTHYTVEIERISEEMAKTKPVIATRIAAGDLDILIADEEDFNDYLQKNVLIDLKEILPDQIESQIANRVGSETYQASSERAKATETGNAQTTEQTESVYAISLQGLEKAEACTKYMENPVLGVFIGEDSYEEELLAIQYFLGFIS